MTRGREGVKSHGVAGAGPGPATEGAFMARLFPQLGDGTLHHESVSCSYR